MCRNNVTGILQIGQAHPVPFPGMAVGPGPRWAPSMRGCTHQDHCPHAQIPNATTLVQVLPCTHTLCSPCLPCWCCYVCSCAGWASQYSCEQTRVCAHQHVCICEDVCTHVGALLCAPMSACICVCAQASRCVQWCGMHVFIFVCVHA